MFVGLKLYCLLVESLFPRHSVAIIGCCGKCLVVLPVHWHYLKTCLTTPTLLI